MGKEVLEASWLSPQHFQGKLADLIAESRSFALAEDLDSISILLSDWLPNVRLILTEALTVLAELENLAEQATRDRADIREGWSKSTGTLVLPRAFDELADVCFIAAAECKACQKELSTLTSDSEPFTLLVVMERCQSRLSGSLCAVEERLARMSGHASRTRHVDLGRKSLRARRLVARLRRRMANVARQAEADVEKKLRSIGTSLAWLLGHDHFSNLRASDRLTAKLLHQRIVEWLRSEESLADDGRRLWQDVRAFVELLRLINRRPEVVRHDFRVVLEASSLLADSDPHGPLPCSVVEPLDSILGRDELLDEMLGSGAEVSRVLARLLEIYSLLEREGAEPETREATAGHGSANLGAGDARKSSPSAGGKSAVA